MVHHKHYDLLKMNSSWDLVHSASYAKHYCAKSV